MRYMPITAETTDEQITAPIEAARENLAAGITARYGAKELARLVNEVAEAEGAARARYMVRQVLAHGMGRLDDDREGSARDQLVAGLLRGADDGWSGRQNDAARADFDGFRAAAKGLLEDL